MVNFSPDACLENVRRRPWEDGADCGLNLSGKSTWRGNQSDQVSVQFLLVVKREQSLPRRPPSIQAKYGILLQSDRVTARAPELAPFISELIVLNAIGQVIGVKTSSTRQR